MVNPNVRPGEHSFKGTLRAQLKGQHLGGGFHTGFVNWKQIFSPLLHGGLLLLQSLGEGKSQFTVAVKLLSTHLALYLNLTFSEAHARGL